jgi:hypothetical protein
MAVPKRALGVGDSIEVGADIRHWDHFSLRRGEQGIIEDIDPETGDILIRLRVSRPELKSWDNRLWVPAPYAKRLRLIRRLWLASAIVLAVVAAPLVWFAADRTPTFRLKDGVIEPNTIHKRQWQLEAGSTTWKNVDTGKEITLKEGEKPPAASAAVIWKWAEFSGRDCPGNTSRELVDSHRNLFPFLTRARAGVFHPDANDSAHGYVTTPPLVIADAMAPGPAVYYVTVFYYCNWLQRLLDWPIVAKYPPIQFEVVGEIINERP